MTEALDVWPIDWTLAPDALVRTETGAKLHIPSCPHIRSRIRLADAAERLAMTVWTWCRAELDGVGRTYLDTLEDAMREFGTHAGTERLVRGALRFATYDQIWVPHSRSYVALGHEGRAVAWFGKSWVVPVRGQWLELPDYRAGRGGGAARDERVGEVCDVHFVTRSLTGVCELCE